MTLIMIFCLMWFSYGIIGTIATFILKDDVLEHIMINGGLAGVNATLVLILMELI